MKDKLFPNKVNFHFINQCNYGCKYCFAKKENTKCSLNKAKSIVDKIELYFATIKEKGTINLVGGEVFLFKHLQELIDYINDKAIDVSIVTNGSMLTKEFIVNNKSKIKMIGISVDSLEKEINLKIGRALNGKTLEENNLLYLCNTIKNNDIELKINHCVSKFNINEDISWFIEKVTPKRFKIFQMTIIDGINNEMVDKQISKEQFRNYCEKYKKMAPIIEENQEIKNGYFMIDGIGNCFTNMEEKQLGNILSEDINNIIKKINVDEKTYIKRYNNK